MCFACTDCLFVSTAQISLCSLHKHTGKKCSAIIIGQDLYEGSGVTLINDKQMYKTEHLIVSPV